MEAGKEKGGPKDVVLHISAAEESVFTTATTQGTNNELTQFQNLTVKTPIFVGSPDVSKPSPSPSASATPSSTANKPPKIPAFQSLNRRKPLARSEFSRPKSRLIEPNYPDDPSLKLEKTQLGNAPNVASSPNNAPGASSPKEKDNLRSASVTPKTPLLGTLGPEDEEDEDEEVYKSASLKEGKGVGKKWKFFVLAELTVFVCLVALLIASLVIDKLQHFNAWGLKLWKWCVLVLVVVCGRLVTEWSMNILVFLIERNFLFKKKVLYFVYGVKKSVQGFLWLGFILLAWGLLFNHGVKRTRRSTRILNYVTRALGGFLIGAAMWLLKTLLVKLLASSFHVNRFFDRIQESIFHQYVLRVLSGPPIMEMAVKVGSSKSMSGQLSFTNLTKKDAGKKEEVIDVDKLKKMKHGKVSAWTMKGLIDVIRYTGLSTLSSALDHSDDEDGEKKNKEITSEWEAKATAYKIFRNVARPDSKHIDEEDLLRFMKKEEVDNVIPLFEGAAETGKIKRSALKKWVVNVYNERKSLAHSLNDTKTAIEELNRLLSGIVLVVIIIVWFIVMGLLTTQILVFISSQLLLVAFMFGNTAKTVFEAIIFVFDMHPFDVGDRCVIDGVQMVVEEMNILNTVFLRYDNEKIYYPNSVLATKPISNFYRSPEMIDTVEFAVDVATSIETIGVLKSRIKAYLESKPQHWRPSHSVQVKEIENVNKMKMALFVNHTINFQNAGNRGNRRSDLVLEMKKIFEELGIQYHLPPQEVHVSYIGSAVPHLAR